jgi:DNA-binding NtrC family response regulator
MTDRSPEKQGDTADPAGNEELRKKIEGFILDAAEQLGTGLKEITDEAMDFLMSHRWQGGDRDLELAVKRACILSEDSILHLEDFDIKLRQARSVGKFVETRLRSYVKKITRFEEFDLYDMVIPEVEKSLIMMVLQETKGNQVRAARLLGINRNTLRSKIRKLKIKI